MALHGFRDNLKRWWFGPNPSGKEQSSDETLESAAEGIHIRLPTMPWLQQQQEEEEEEEERSDVQLEKEVEDEVIVAAAQVQAEEVASLEPPKPVRRKKAKVVIIGAGMAGLSCATELQNTGERDFLILESSDAPGGRVRTDVHEQGYLLDRGFQVFIEEYPEAQALFNSSYEALELRQFLPGALVFFDKQLHVVSDPFRRPQDLLASLISPIGSLLDKVKVGLFSIYIRIKDLADIEAQDETTTLDYLSSNLSPLMVSRFFAPFYQGIFLSPLSLQSSRMFEFVFKMFTQGAASLPKLGMGQVAVQAANALPTNCISYNTKVTRISLNEEGGGDDYLVHATDNHQQQDSPLVVVECKYVVLAADPESALDLLSPLSSHLKAPFQIPEKRGSVCLYFGFDGPPPVLEPCLILNGENDLLLPVESSSTSTSTSTSKKIKVNNVCFPSQVSEAYAPPGKSLASVTIVIDNNNNNNNNNGGFPSDSELEAAVRSQLAEWWGQETVATWDLLRTYKIPYAQPAQTPPYDFSRRVTLARNLHVCGDHRDTATLNGAIKAGKRAARELGRVVV